MTWKDWIILVPSLVLVTGVVGKLIELHVRRIFDARDKELDERYAPKKSTSDAMAAIRTDNQSAIGGVGNDAMEALEMCRCHAERIATLETKVGVYWKTVEQEMANLLRQSRHQK